MILVALGSNRSGAWGTPEETVSRAICRLNARSDTAVLIASALYRTAAIGPGQPEDFVNAVIAIETHCGPHPLLRRLKWIERQAGPRSAIRWGPRTLDLDILDFRGLIRGWRWINAFKPSVAAARGSLVLPHPMMHLRPFVLEPLREILPYWRHPVLHRTADELFGHSGAMLGGDVLCKLERI